MRQKNVRRLVSLFALLKLQNLVPQCHLPQRSSSPCQHTAIVCKQQVKIPPFQSPLDFFVFVEVLTDRYFKRHEMPCGLDLSTQDTKIHEIVCLRKLFVCQVKVRLVHLWNRKENRDYVQNPTCAEACSTITWGSPESSAAHIATSTLNRPEELSPAGVIHAGSPQRNTKEHLCQCLSQSVVWQQTMHTWSCPHGAFTHPWCTSTTELTLHAEHRMKPETKTPSSFLQNDSSGQSRSACWLVTSFRFGEFSLTNTHKQNSAQCGYCLHLLVLHEKIINKISQKWVVLHDNPHHNDQSLHTYTFAKSRCS